MALIPRFTTGPGVNSLAGAKFLGTNVNATLDAGTVVSPSPYSLKLTQGAAGAQAQTDTITPISEIYGHFYFRKTATPTATNEILTVYDGALVSYSIRLTNANKIFLYDRTGALAQTGVTVLASATWYRIEIYHLEGADAASSEVTVKLYNATGTLLETITDTNILVQGCGRLTYQCGIKDNNTDYFFSHMIWCDTTGGEMDSWIGDSRVTHHTVDGIGNYNDAVDTKEEHGGPDANISYGTEGGVGTLTDTGRSWAVNEWAGGHVRDNSGLNWMMIASNTATKLTGSEAWTPNQPADASGYEIWLGDSANWENVDENPPDDAATANHFRRDNWKETYTVITPTYNADARAVSVEMWGRTTGTPGATILTRYSGSDHDGTVFNPWHSTWCWGGEQIFYDEPGASVLTLTNTIIGNMEIGLKMPADVDESVSENVQLSGAWVCVVYDQTAYSAPGGSRNRGYVMG